MHDVETIRVIFPEAFRGDFAFYPIIIIAVSVIILLILGLWRGIKTYVAGMQDEISDSDSKGLIRALCILQMVCLLSIAVSVFVHKHPHVRPGGMEWEVGFGFFFALAMLIFMIGPAVLQKVDYVLFLVGEIPAFLYGLTNGRNFRPGCRVVQTVQKHSRTPGPRAKEIHPQAHGDYIDYVVDKFRRVVAVGSDAVTVLTRRGKVLRLKASDPMLRKAGLIESLHYYNKFPPKDVL